jgi:hypothetical protein
LGSINKGGVKLPKGTKQQFVILLILSLYVLFTGAKDVWNKVQIKMDGVTTTGVVIESRSDSANDSSESIIQFTDENEQIHTFKTSAGYKVGRTIGVRYKRNDPSIAYTTDFIGMWFWTAFLLTMGIILFFTSIVGLLADSVKK